MIMQNSRFVYTHEEECSDKAWAEYDYTSLKLLMKNEKPAILLAGIAGVGKTYTCCRLVMGIPTLNVFDDPEAMGKDIPFNKSMLETTPFIATVQGSNSIEAIEIFSSQYGIGENEIIDCFDYLVLIERRFGNIYTIIPMHRMRDLMGLV